MTEQAEAIQEQEEVVQDQAEVMSENGANVFTQLTGAAVKTIMVGLGVVGFAQDEIMKILDDSGAFVERLEERGMAMSEDGREKIESQREKVATQFETRQGQVKELGTVANETLEKASGAVLTHANVPTAEDIQNLSKQISALSRKVDKVRKEQQELAGAQD